MLKLGCTLAAASGANGGCSRQLLLLTRQRLPGNDDVVAAAAATAAPSILLLQRCSLGAAAARWAGPGTPGGGRQVGQGDGQALNSAGGSAEAGGGRQRFERAVLHQLCVQPSIAGVADLGQSKDGEEGERRA